MLALLLLSLRTHGELGAPNIIKYYYAKHLNIIASWSSQYAPNRWSEIEMDSLYPVQPCSLIWSFSLHNDATLKRLCLAPMLFILTKWQTFYKR